jgi:hypothetical protein
MGGPRSVDQLVHLYQQSKILQIYIRYYYRSPTIYELTPLLSTTSIAGDTPEQVAQVPGAIQKWKRSTATEQVICGEWLA